jgi:hypothetical protein
MEMMFPGKLISNMNIYIVVISILTIS